MSWMIRCSLRGDSGMKILYGCPEVLNRKKDPPDYIDDFRSALEMTDTM